MTGSRLDTIVAVVTPHGRGAISVIRLSGPLAVPITRSLLRHAPHSLPGRKPIPAIICDREGCLLDRVLVTFFPSPASYTGEDVVEISCHGSPVVTRLVLEACLAQGGRLAEPGEYTLRAFLNGKLDLAQAEGIRDLIESQTRFQSRVAAQQAEGRLSRELRPLKEELVKVISHLEAGLEFVEEDLGTAGRWEAMEVVTRVRQSLEEMSRSFKAGKLVREGLRVTLAGKPNAGKSSLFNALLRERRAIVTAIPGTTRDALTETFSLEGIPVRLADTAGIRQPADQVEKLGVEKSLEFVRESDVVLFILDRSRPYDEDDQKIWEQLEGRNCLLVKNKSDLESQLEVPDRIRLRCGGEVEVSALQETGLDSLRQRLLQTVLPGGGLEVEQVLVTNLRHYRCLECACQALERAGRGLQAGLSEEYPLYDLRKSLEALGEITGETRVEDILDHIFSTFCVGK